MTCFGLLTTFTRRTESVIAELENRESSNQLSSDQSVDVSEVEMSELAVP